MGLSTVLACLLLPSVVSALVPNFKNRAPAKTHAFNYTELAHAATHGRRPHAPEQHQPRSSATTHFHVSWSGHVVRVDELVLVYYDAKLVSPLSLRLSLHDGEGAPTDCTPFLDLSGAFEYASLLLRDCVGIDVLPDVGADGERLEWHVSAELRGGSEEVREEFDVIVWNIPKHPWPLSNDEEPWPPSLPNLVGNTVENYQSFSGQGNAYWHEGIDIRSPLVGDFAQPCHSPVAGRVVNIVRYSPSDLYWSIMVEDEWGFIWQFHHLDPSTFEVDTGDSVAVGDVLGDIAYWPSMWNGVRYHHLHLNVVRPHPTWDTVPDPYIDGWQYFNPFLFFDNGAWEGGGPVPVTDGVMFFLPNEGNTAFASSLDPQLPLLSGKVDVVMSWESEFGATNAVTGHPYPNGLYRVGYSVDGLIPGGLAGNSSNLSNLRNLRRTFQFRDLGTLGLPFAAPIVAPKILLSAPKIPNEWAACLPDLRVADADAMLRRVFKQAFSYDGQQHTSVFTYQQRKLWYTLTNSRLGQPDAESGFWDTAELLPDGGGPRFATGHYLVTGFGCDVFEHCVAVSHPVRVDND